MNKRLTDYQELKEIVINTYLKIDTKSHKIKQGEQQLL